MTKRHVVTVLPAVRTRTIGVHALTRAGLLTNSYDVTVVSDSFPDVRPSGVHCIQIAGRSFNYLGRFCHVPNELGFACAARREVKRLHSRKPIDFILCHGYTLTRFVGQYLWDKKRVHYGMFMHGHIFNRPPGTYDSRLTTFYERLAPGCYKKAHLVFALSPDQAECAIKAGTPENRIVITPNGVRRDDFEAICTEIDGVRSAESSIPMLRMLYVGRLSPEKGVSSLLTACQLLAEWKVDYSLTVVGDGPEYNQLNEQVIRSGISRSVKFVRPVPRKHLAAYYRAADVLCVPSIDEALGNVVLEGIICGCPVVGSDVGGIRFIISDGKTGYLVPADQPKQWAEKLKSILENKEELESIAQNGRKMVEMRFNWKDIVFRMDKAIARTVA